MGKYHKNNYTDLLDAINDASDWERFATPDEYENLTKDELEKICLQRCLEKYEFIIDNFKSQIDSLCDEITDDETYNQKKLSSLEKQIDSLVDIMDKTTFPSKTLIDVEKIEFIKDNWDKLTYDNLKASVTKQPDNIIIENLYGEIDSLVDEIAILNDEIRFLNCRLNR